MKHIRAMGSVILLLLCVSVSIQALQTVATNTNVVVHQAATAWPTANLSQR